MSYVKGGNKVRANLDKYLQAELKKQIGRMRKSVLLVRRESQKIVPVDTSNLKNSAFTNVSFSEAKIEGTVGYYAAYAPFVHERLDLTHKSGKSAKFLEKPLKASMGKIIQILRGKG